MKEVATYNWDPNTKKSHVILHKRTLEAGIKYHKNRKNQDEVDNLQMELDSLNSFYNGIF